MLRIVLYRFNFKPI